MCVVIVINYSLFLNEVARELQPVLVCRTGNFFFENQFRVYVLSTQRKKERVSSAAICQPSEPFLDHKQLAAGENILAGCD